MCFLHRWRTHRSPEYFVNFRRFKLPVSLESAKRRCYKALSHYSETHAHMETLKELCIDVYQRHHARKLAAWSAFLCIPFGPFACFFAQLLLPSCFCAFSHTFYLVVKVNLCNLVLPNVVRTPLPMLSSCCVSHSVSCASVCLCLCCPAWPHNVITSCMLSTRDAQASPP